MTRTDFDAQIGRLIILRGWPDDVEEYFSALADIPADVFAAACDHALKSRTFFPVPAELRTDCDAVKARVRRPEPEALSYQDLADAPTVEIKNPFGEQSIFVKVVREWKHDCEACGDTGWASVRCPEIACGRRFDHGPHEFVEVCACIHWNPTIRRRKEAAAKYSKSVEDARRSR